jgi:hypothetical protein
MASREELKALIDQIPEDQFDRTARMIQRCLAPLPPILPPGSPGSFLRPAPPEFTAMMRRREAYKKEVMRCFEESGNPGTLGVGMPRFHFEGSYEQVRYGGQSFQYWDHAALVSQELHYFDGRDVEIMVRLSVSDEQSLCCAVEVSSGGKTVRYSDQFSRRPN